MKDGASLDGASFLARKEGRVCVHACESALEEEQESQQEGEQEGEQKAERDEKAMSRAGEKGRRAGGPGVLVATVLLDAHGWRLLQIPQLHLLPSPPR